MTEFWVSQSNKWCDYCKCWLKDTAQAWAVHERGSGHQENVARKLREMRQKQDRDKRDEAHLAAAMTRVEFEAQRQFKADQKAEAEAVKARLGEWIYKAEVGYYYNPVHRWYFDPKTRMYYGGEPVDWTDKPTMPHEARYEVMNKPAAPAAPAAARGSAGSSGSAAAAAAAGQKYAVAGSRVVNKHPLSEVGGYQLHSIQGSVGGAKGVGHASRGGSSSAGASAGTAADAKRKRDGGAAAGGSKELSKEDREFMARREAARQRVQQRTAASFGLT